MPHAIQIKTFGGPEVMEYVDLPVGDPPPGQVRIRQDDAAMRSHR